MRTKYSHSDSWMLIADARNIFIQINANFSFICSWYSQPKPWRIKIRYYQVDSIKLDPGENQLSADKLMQSLNQDDAGINQGRNFSGRNQWGRSLPLRQFEWWNGRDTFPPFFHSINPQFNHGRWNGNDRATSSNHCTTPLVHHSTIPPFHYSTTDGVMVGTGPHTIPLSVTTKDAVGEQCWLHRKLLWSWDKP